MSIEVLRVANDLFLISEHIHLPLKKKKSKAQDCPCAYKVLHTADF